MKRYKISMRIPNPDPANVDEIQTAVDDYLLFGEREWSEKPGEMRVSALCDLRDNLDIGAFAARLHRLVCHANNAICSVMVSASHLNGRNYVSSSELVNRGRSGRRRWNFPQDLLVRQ
jgi:hypothetical protein